MGQSCNGSEGPLNQDETIFLDSDPNKNSYKGEVDELGRPNGKGVFFYSKDGSKFQGQFDVSKRKNGKLIIKDTQQYKDRYYEGQFNELCEPHGQGKWHFKDKNGVTLYDGTFKNRFFIQGTVHYGDGSKFKGTMEEGKKSGELCEFWFPNEDKFTGRFQNDEFVKGTFETKKGEIKYKGQFKKFQRDGEGELTIQRGVHYIGQFKNDQFHGRGQLRNLVTNSEYKGYFKQGKKHGTGKQTTASGAEYDGEFQDDKRSGKGKLTDKNKKYEGNFLNGKFEGYGILQSQNGSIYKGQFHDGKKHGLGKLTFKKDGDLITYQGQFIEGKACGKGKINYSNGDSYQGDFKQNKRDGYGVYWNKQSNQYYEGNWSQDARNGQFVERKIKEGIVISGKFSNGQREGKFIYVDEHNHKSWSENWKNGVIIQESKIEEDFESSKNKISQFNPKEINERSKLSQRQNHQENHEEKRESRLKSDISHKLQQKIKQESKISQKAKNSNEKEQEQDSWGQKPQI